MPFLPRCFPDNCKKYKQEFQTLDVDGVMENPAAPQERSLNVLI